MLLTTASLQGGQLAFPGAAGWGRWAQGARRSATPTVYHVTNLNDSGAGSLRDAVSRSGRIVVFDVSGVIQLQSRIVFASDLYVAGQTAPGEGVTLYGDGVSFSGASNIICRYLRVRMGHGGTSGKDCAGVANGHDMIFDHCSFSWGLDETFSVNAFGQAWNITLQNSIIGQGLMTHSAGGLMQADSITLYRNLYIDNSTRNNKVKGTNQYANNVVYNWSNGCYIMGGDSEGSSYVNIESNLFINGPSGGGNCFGGANQDFHCYGVDNWQDANKDGQYNPTEVTNYSASDHRTTDPYDYPVLPLYPGNELLERNIPTVGASLPYRDLADCYMVEELMSLGKRGALISNEESLPIGSPTTWDWWQGETRQDTDGDGMPDAWELANGTNVNVADATLLADNGYLNIENYINAITVADRQFHLRRPLTLTATATTTTLTLTWRDYTYDEQGFIVERQDEEGQWQTVANVSANATTCTLTQLQPGTTYPLRVCAWRGNASTGKADEMVSEVVVYSDYTEGTFKTKPTEVGIVDIDTYQPQVTNTTEEVDDCRLLLTTDTTLDYTLNNEITPACIVALGRGVITVSGEGAIAGEGTSLNKGGEGTLRLTNVNSYTGATVLHDGVLEFNSIANGGEASSLGASQEFAQNWVMDGGTYRYTGSTNATTNRSARLMSPTTLEIASGKTLTMIGSIEGTGDEQALTLDGNGQVTVASLNFFGYSGQTTLRGGTLYLSTTDIAKKGIGASSRLVLAGGTLKTKGESSNYETYSFPIEVEENTHSIFAPNRNCYMKNVLTGAGTLEVQIPYLREYFDFNTNGFTGRLIANGVSTDKDGALMLKEKSYNSPRTIVTLRGNAKLCVWETQGNSYLGGLAGDKTTYLMASSKQTDGTTCTWTIGSANSDETFAGVICNRCCASGHYAKANNINKVGTGLWRLTGKNVYTGTTNVKEGTLVLNGQHIEDSNSNAKKYATAACTYNIYEGAMLRGTGRLVRTSTVNVRAGGTLMAGDTLTDRSVLDLTGATVNVAASGRLAVSVVSETSDEVRSNLLKVGALTLDAGAVLAVEMQVSPEGLADDTRIAVFDGAVKATGRFEQIEPAVPGEGQEWDTSELFTAGCLIVRAKGYTEGIETVPCDSPQATTLAYDLLGRPLNKTKTVAKTVTMTKTNNIIISR